jgi:hypothetical protein
MGVRMRSFCSFFLIFTYILFTGAFSNGLLAEDSGSLGDPGGRKSPFKVDFLDESEAAWMASKGFKPRNLTPFEKEAVLGGLEYFRYVLNPVRCPEEAGKSCVARLVVGGDDSGFVTGYPRTPQGTQGDFNFVLAQDILARGIPRSYNESSPRDYALALSLGSGAGESLKGAPTEPGLSLALESLAIAELFRALGLYAPPEGEAKETQFSSLIKKEGGEEAFYGETAGLVYGDGVFRALPMERKKLETPKVFLKLKGSLLSDSFFVNHPAPMEAELAILNDLGYEVTLKNHFGRSLYSDGATLTNGEGFLSSAPYGVGLHVYGNYDTVVQEADLSSLGPKGIGVRIDGVGDSLTIGPNSVIKALGQGGAGILMAFGKDHSLLLQGEIRAKEDALRCDMGGLYLNASGSPTPEPKDTPPRLSSFFKAPEGAEDELLPFRDALNGPMVKTIVLEGLLSGEKRALYLSPDAYAEKLIIRSGAKIEGDLISDYDDLGRGTSLGTRIVFGETGDESVSPDPQSPQAPSDTSKAPPKPPKDPKKPVPPAPFEFRLSGRVLGSGKAPEGNALYSGRGLIDLEFYSGVVSLEDSSRIEVNKVVLEKGASLLIKPDLSSRRPIFLEANDIDFKEGSKLIVSASTTQGERGKHLYLTPVLKISPLKGSFLNKASLELDPASGLTGGSLWWFTGGGKDHLLCYVRPGARFPE